MIKFKEIGYFSVDEMLKLFKSNKKNITPTMRILFIPSKDNIDVIFSSLRVNISAKIKNTFSTEQRICINALRFFQMCETFDIHSNFSISYGFDENSFKLYVKFIFQNCYFIFPMLNELDKLNDDDVLETIKDVAISNILEVLTNGKLSGEIFINEKNIIFENKDFIIVSPFENFNYNGEILRIKKKDVESLLNFYKLYGAILNIKQYDETLKIFSKNNSIELNYDIHKRSFPVFIRKKSPPSVRFNTDEIKAFKKILKQKSNIEIKESNDNLFLNIENGTKLEIKWFVIEPYFTLFEKIPISSTNLLMLYNIFKDETIDLSYEKDILSINCVTSPNNSTLYFKKLPFKK